MADPVWTPGTLVTVTEELHGAVWAHWVETVEHDAGGVLATLQCDGTPLTFPPHPFPHPWGGRAAWAGTTVLKLRRPGDWYAVWKFFDATGAFQYWYVNFETPFQRRPDGIVVNDLQLDIVLAGDGSWRWKDVQDLAPALATGRMQPDELGPLLTAASQMATLLDDPDRAGDHWWAPWRDWTPGRGRIGA